MSYKPLFFVIVGLSLSTLTRFCFSQNDWTLEEIVAGVLQDEKSIEDAKLVLSVERYYPPDGTEDIRSQKSITNYQKWWDKTSPAKRRNMPTPELFALSEERYAKWAKEDGRARADYEITFKAENMFIQHEYKVVTRIGGPPINAHRVRASDGKLYWGYSEHVTDAVELYKSIPKTDRHRELEGRLEGRRWKGKLSNLLLKKKVKLIGTEKFDNRQCPALEIILEKGSLKVIVDPELGFSWTKKQFESAGRVETEVFRRGFRQCAPRIWRPSEVEYLDHEYDLDGERILKYKKTVTVKKAEVNTGIADTAFAFHLPPDRTLVDHRYEPPFVYSPNEIENIIEDILNVVPQKK